MLRVPRSSLFSGLKPGKRLHGGGKGKGVRKVMVVGVRLVEWRKDFGGRRYPGGRGEVGGGAILWMHQPLPRVVALRLSWGSGTKQLKMDH